MTTRWLITLALVLACSKPKPQQTAQPLVSVCPKVADHLVSLMSGAQKHPADATDPLRRVIDHRCEQDAWTAETKQCLLSLANLSEGDRCQKMMTPAQVEAFHRDSEAATVELRGQFTEQPPPKRPLAPPDATSAD
jgi:hypothetical protein